MSTRGVKERETERQHPHRVSMSSSAPGFSQLQTMDTCVPGELGVSGCKVRVSHVEHHILPPCHHPTPSLSVLIEVRGLGFRADSRRCLTS